MEKKLCIIELIYCDWLWENVGKKMKMTTKDESSGEPCWCQVFMFSSSLTPPAPHNKLGTIIDKETESNGGKATYLR